MTLSLSRFVEPHVSRLRPCILANKVTLWILGQNYGSETVSAT